MNGNRLMSLPFSKRPASRWHWPAMPALRCGTLFRYPVSQMGQEILKNRSKRLTSKSRRMRGDVFTMDSRSKSPPTCSRSNSNMPSAELSIYSVSCRSTTKLASGGSSQYASRNALCESNINFPLTVNVTIRPSSDRETEMVMQDTPARFGLNLF